LKTVVLITCTKTKHNGVHKAEYLYSASQNFVKYLESARSVAADSDIYVISALYNLIPLTKEIKSYDYSLSEKSEQEQYAWGNGITEHLSEHYDINNTKFIVIADEDYCLPLLKNLPFMDMPLEGVGCGPDGYEQLDEYIRNFNAENIVYNRKGVV